MQSKTFQRLAPRLFRQTLQANFNIFAQKQTLIIAKFPKFSIYIANHAMTTKRFHSCYLRTFATQNDSSKKQLNTSVDLKSEEDKSQNERPIDIGKTEEGMRLSQIMFTRFLKENWSEEKWPRKDFDENFGKDAKMMKALNLINAKQIAEMWTDDIFWIGFEIEGELVLMKDDGYFSQTIIYCTDPKIFDKLKTALVKIK